MRNVNATILLPNKGDQRRLFMAQRPPVQHCSDWHSPWINLGGHNARRFEIGSLELCISAEVTSPNQERRQSYQHSKFSHLPKMVATTLQRILQMSLIAATALSSTSLAAAAGYSTGFQVCPEGKPCIWTRVTDADQSKPAARVSLASASYILHEGLDCRFYSDNGCQTQSNYAATVPGRSGPVVYKSVQMVKDWHAAGHTILGSLSRWLYNG